MHTSSELSPDTIAEIERMLAELDDPESETSKRFAATMAAWEERMRPLIEAIRATERLTAEDYAVTITR